MLKERSMAMSEKIKNILSSPEVPEKLHPENIPDLIENSNVRKRKIRHTARYVSAIAACAVIVTGSVLLLPDNAKSSTNLSFKSEDAVQSIDTVYDFAGPEENNDSCETNIYANELAFVPVGSYETIYKQMKKNSDNYIKDEEYYFAENEVIINKNETFTETDGSDNSDDNYNVNTSQTSQETDVYETLSQVEGIAEADIIKANANCVYFVNGKMLAYIPFDSKSGKFGECSYIDISEISEKDGNVTVKDMYISENRLTVIAEIMKYPEERGYYCSADIITGVFIFDISENTPVLLESSFQSGDYSSSRMKDDILYLITNQTTYFGSAVSEENYEDYIPCFGNDIDEMKCLETNCIYIPVEWENKTPDVQFVNISGIDIYSPSEPVSAISVAGYTGQIYCSNENLYLTQQNWDEKYTTSITRFAFENGVIAPQASGDIDGYILNQFSMDEWNGYFRAASTSYDYSRLDDTVSTEPVNNLYVLDMDMNIVGSITGFAETETIKSVTFNGNIGYVVTYERTDPLFAIDLSNPYSPVITDEFKISGYSSFLRKWSDDKLLGFGVDADDNAIEVGVKLVMFDTSDSGELKECGFYSISKDMNNEIYSNAVYDRKSLLLDSSKNLIGFPITCFNYNNYYDDDEFYSTLEHEQTYRIFSYDNGEFTEQCVIKSSSDNCYDAFVRGIYIGDYICVFSTNEAVSVNMKTFEETDRIKFDKFEYDNEYLID